MLWSFPVIYRPVFFLWFTESIVDYQENLFSAPADLIVATHISTKSFRGKDIIVTRTNIVVANSGTEAKQV